MCHITDRCCARSQNSDWPGLPDSEAESAAVGHRPADAVGPGTDFGGGLGSGRPASRPAASTTLSREMHCRAWCSVVAKVFGGEETVVQSSASWRASQNTTATAGPADVQLGEPVGYHGGRTWLSLNSGEYRPSTTTATRGKAATSTTWSLNSPLVRLAAILR